MDKVLINSHGQPVPVSTIPALTLLKDETVRSIIARAEETQELIIAFKEEVTGLINDYLDLANQEYGANPMGEKGNITFPSYDGMMKVVINTSERIHFEGEKLNAARSLFMECLREWTYHSRPELKAMIEDALNTDKQGRVNRWQILRILRLKSDDERFRKAQMALRDSMAQLDNKSYLRFYQKDTRGNWQHLNLNFSSL